VLQSTYETLASCAREHFDGTLQRRLVLTSGLGTMGGAQPLATSLLGGVTLVCEVAERRADRRIGSGYLEEKTTDVAWPDTRIFDEAGIRRSPTARARWSATGTTSTSNSTSA
jgi:urocanate hydratase